MRVAKTARDEEIIRAAYSLGYVTGGTLRELVSPTTGIDTFTARLRLLCSARYLTRVRVVDQLRHTYLYGLGVRARVPGSPPPWRPAIAQLDHTFAVEGALVALLRTGFASPVHVIGWAGEAEVRDWATPGSPFPDLRVAWELGEVRGRWDVEVDLATESRAALRRKFARYLVSPPRTVVLVITTTDQRARNVANLAREIGAPVVVTTTRALQRDDDPLVFDAIHHARQSLSAAARAAAAIGAASGR